MGHLKKAGATRGRMWLAAPFLVCLPCLAPFALGTILIGVGAGATGSFFIDNAVLLAILITAAMLAALVIGLGIARLARWRGDGMRILSPED